MAILELPPSELTVTLVTVGFSLSVALLAISTGRAMRRQIVRRRLNRFVDQDETEAAE